MKRRTVSKLRRPFLHALGLSLCVIPPAACTLTYFPLWREAGAYELLSGGVLLLLVLSAVPLFRLIKQRLRSVAAWGIWLLLFLLFFALSGVADEMTVIAFTGFISNLLGAACIRLSRAGKTRASQAKRDSAARSDTADIEQEAACDE